MKKLALVLLLVLGLGVMSAGMVRADVINVGDPLPALPTTWYAFFAGQAGTGNSFGVGTNVANNITPGATPWTYSSPLGATAVKITDTSSAGDMFRLYDFGAVVGDTSTVPTTAIGTTNIFPDLDYADPILSHGLFILPAGNHSLTIEIIQNTDTLTEAIGYFRVDAAAVPLPPSAWLLGSSLLGLVGWRRFRKV
jgi:hypothetical protein